jgi:hypothetical protein
MCKRWLWKLAALSIGTSLGKLEWGSFTGNFERDSKRALCKRTVSFCGTSVRGSCREGSYTDDSDRHVMEGSGNGAFLL